MPKMVEKYETDSATSQRMKAVRTVNTSPEQIVRRCLDRLRVRYRLNRSDLPGKPDIVLASRRKIIFVHGCFWHRHSDCRRATLPKRNQALWTHKFHRTVERDRINIQLLRGAGWQVLVLWECEILDELGLSGILSQFINKEDEQLDKCIA